MGPAGLALIPSGALRVLAPLLNAGDGVGLPVFLKELESELARIAEKKTGLLGELSAYVLTGSGKRVRPGLVFLSAQFGNSSPAAVKDAALAVELIHIATLAHDDLVDEAVIRRQRPTVGIQFGEGAAVLLGDYVYAEAFRVLSRLGLPVLIDLLAETTMTMCEGEIDQYEARYRFDMGEKDYLSFLRRKTAALMAASCRVGGVLAGLPEPHVRALETFGDRLGVAFQVVDDILDIEGEESVVGKTLHTDLTHGKMTLPLIDYAGSLKSEKERMALFDVLKNPGDKLGDLIELLRRSGALDRSKARVKDLLSEAEGALAPLPDAPAKRLLLEAAQRLSDRRA